MNNHPVLTLEHPSNLQNGIIICGINFGYSDEDARLEEAGQTHELDAPSYFSDTRVNNTIFRNRILKWLLSWDIPLSTKPGNETELDYTFFQTNWLNTQSHDISTDEKITNKTLVDDSDGILGLIESRKPRLVIFVGSMLIEALNDISIRDRIESLIGKRPGNAIIHYSANSDPQEKRFKVLTQDFEFTRVVSLPHTNTIGLSDAYMAGFKELLQEKILSV